MIDAALAERLALLLAGGAGDMSAQPDWFGARVERAAERIVEVTGLRPAGTLPSPEWLDRGGWAAANLASTGSLLNPLLDRVGENLGMLAGPARAGVSYIASAELGALLGIVGRRVLGQYELALLDPSVPPRLLFVGPNIDAVALGMDVERDELADWVIFHEVTHAVQFGGVPWLRDHISALLRDLLGDLELKVDPGAISRMPSADDLKALAAAVRDGGLLAVVGPASASCSTACRRSWRSSRGTPSGPWTPRRRRSSRHSRSCAPRSTPAAATGRPPCACSTACSGSR